MLILIVALAYVIGSIPMGYLVVKAISRQDVRQIGNGHTGGTSALRAAGVPAGLLTGVLDVLKGAAGVWLAQAVLSPGARPAGMALAGLAAMLGHCYSIFLHFKGAAGGGAPALGAAFAMWPLSVLIAVPVAAVVLLAAKVGRLAELAMALAMLVLLVGLAYFDQVPPAYAWFGAGAVALLAWQARAVLWRRYSAIREK
jgi:glycerol-3-phosphate acyltransferase PlsY